MLTYIDRIADLGVYPEALAWLRTEAHPDLATAWAACPRADWLIWLAGRCAEPGSAEHRAVVLAAADCAAAVEDLAPDASAADAVETARRLVRGEATAEECREATRAARAGAAAADAAYVADAARAAAYAADAAYAARAAAEAAYVADAAADAAGRRVDFAAIVRRNIPNPPSL